MVNGFGQGFEGRGFVGRSVHGHQHHGVAGGHDPVQQEAESACVFARLKAP